MWRFTARKMLLLLWNAPYNCCDSEVGFRLLAKVLPRGSQYCHLKRTVMDGACGGGEQTRGNGCGWSVEFCEQGFELLQLGVRTANVDDGKY